MQAACKYKRDCDIDGSGVEVGGVTYVKFTRKLKTADPTFADSCLSSNQTFNVVYAFGQLTANAEHKPSSTLEIIPKSVVSNKDFYLPDVLKFHGGGVASKGFPGRGSLGLLDLMAANNSAAVGSGCSTPSKMAGFNCTVALTGGSVMLHYVQVTGSGVPLCSSSLSSSLSSLSLSSRDMLAIEMLALAPSK
jgi:hypothetical protein